MTGVSGGLDPTVTALPRRSSLPLAVLQTQDEVPTSSHKVRPSSLHTLTWCFLQFLRSVFFLQLLKELDEGRREAPRHARARAH